MPGSLPAQRQPSDLRYVACETAFPLLKVPVASKRKDSRCHSPDISIHAQWANCTSHVSYREGFLDCLRRPAARGRRRECIRPAERTRPERLADPDTVIRFEADDATPEQEALSSQGSWRASTAATLLRSSKASRTSSRSRGVPHDRTAPYAAGQRGVAVAWLAILDGASLPRPRELQGLPALLPRGREADLP